MNYSVLDIEGDGLNPTKIHCMSVERHINGKVERFTLTDYNQMREYILKEEIIIGHNIIRFDIPVIERILGIKVTAKLYDTLILSWYLFPNLIKHGLDDWGTYFGVPKPKITEGEWLGPLPGETFEQFIAKMSHRCQEDVKINSKLWDKIYEYLIELYDNDFRRVQSILAYLMFKMLCAREQEEIKWKLDVKFTNETLNKFLIEQQNRLNLLADIMPEKIHYRELNQPKKMYKQDGTLSKRGQAWIDVLDELGFPHEYEGSIKLERTREKGNPKSISQLKAWLYELGWKPETFKFNKDKETGEVKRVEQVSLPFGQGICPSVKKLYKSAPELENLEMFYVINHRIGLLKGFLRDVDENGYIQAQISGLTNTMRFKHTTIVNLPGYTGKGDWKDGIHIRGCLIAPEGYVLCGSDMSSLEDRTKQHYMYYYDPDYVKTMIKPGFDPHLDLAEFAGALTAEQISFFKNFDSIVAPTEEDKNTYKMIKSKRHDYKQVNYSAVYGVGSPTMSRNTGKPQAECQALLDAYWGKNWSVKSISKACRVKTINGQMWLFNPVSKFWYSLRYEKDKFSTLNQGTGVFCFDNWVRAARNKGLRMCGQFHDEIITPVKAGDEKIVEQKLRDSITEVNERLKLNRDLDIDVQFGNNYAEIH